jgi:hypothetical protein
VIGSDRFWLRSSFVGSVVPVVAGVALIGFGILIGWLIWG